MKFNITFLVIILFSIHPSFSAEQLASIYELGKTSGEPLFTQKMNYEVDETGLRSTEVNITDAQGRIALRENSITKNGVLVSLKVEQRQLGETYEITQSGKTVIFKRSEKKDKTEEVTDSFLSAPGLEHFILSHWKSLLEGETLYVRLGLAERADTVGLKIFKKDLIKDGEKETVIIRMKPSSIIIAAVVDPVDLYIDSKKMKISRFKGQTFLRKNVDGKLKPLDVEIIYN